MLVLTLQPVAAQGFFCTTQGVKLHYVRRYAVNGKVKWRHVMTIGRVDENPDGSLTVSYSSDFSRPNGKQMYGGPISLKADIGSDGRVTLNLAESMISTLHNIFPKADPISSSGFTSLPSGLRPGDILPDVHAEAKMLGMTYRVSVTDRHVLSLDTLDTAAGRFACVVVSEHKVERAPAYNRTTTAHTWYSPGTGMVRHDTYDSGMRLETVEVLENVE